MCDNYDGFIEKNCFNITLFDGSNIKLAIFKSPVSCRAGETIHIKKCWHGMATRETKKNEYAIFQIGGIADINKIPNCFKDNIDMYTNYCKQDKEDLRVMNMFLEAAHKMNEINMPQEGRVSYLPQNVLRGYDRFVGIEIKRSQSITNKVEAIFPQAGDL